MEMPTQPPAVAVQESPQGVVTLHAQVLSTVASEDPVLWTLLLDTAELSTEGGVGTETDSGLLGAVL